jgi:hypothetical protein
MRRFLSSSNSCLLAFRDVGACIDGIAMVVLFRPSPPAEPLAGKPRPFIPLLLKVGCIGVGIRPVLLLGSEPNSEAFSMAGRSDSALVNGDDGG